MDQDCGICDNIAGIHAGTYPYFVAELETGYVILGHFQFFKGYTLFYCKQCVAELHHLEPTFRTQFLVEMSAVAEAVFRAFQPRKLNYEMLGNTVAHLHWHLFPRHDDDPFPIGPVYYVDDAIWRSEETRPSAEEREILKQTLLRELEKTAGEFILRRSVRAD